MGSARGSLSPEAWLSESISLTFVLLPGFLALHPCLSWLVRVRVRARGQDPLLSEAGLGGKQVGLSPVQCTCTGIWVQKFAPFPSAWSCSPAKASRQPSGLSWLGRAAPETGAAWPRTHLTRPAFSPETAAFRYCFHADTLSFMSPMNAFPSAVLQGGSSPQGKCPCPQPLRSFMPQAFPAQTLRRPCPGACSLKASPATSHCPQSCSGAPHQ